MKSRAQVMGHPLHPILICFPFAFLTGAVAFDILGAWAYSPSWTDVARHLLSLGIVAGLVAAVPGAIDYLSVVPPRSSAKKRATLHMASNVAALLLFAIAWSQRPATGTYPGVLLIALEVLGLLLLSAGGWMGGTLVYRNQIGIDHRYAGAGMWKEETIGAKQGAALVVARPGELEVDQMKLLHIGDRRVALGCTEQGHAAFDDRCTHRGGPLSDGVLICGTVQCPWHGSQFDVHTGKVKQGPAEQPIGTWMVDEQQGNVRLTL